MTLSSTSFAAPSGAPAPAASYTTTAKLLHWLLALALIAALGMGLYMVSLSFSPLRLKLYNWHKWLGVAILVLSLVRLGWRLRHRPPALPAAMQAAMPAWQRLLHHATHHAMYALFFLVPLLGWAYSSAAGFSIVFLGIVPLPDWVPVSEPLAEFLKPLHQWSAYAFAALIVLHIAAAFKHQLIDRDGLLQRMLPGHRA